MTFFHRLLNYYNLDNKDYNHLTRPLTDDALFINQRFDDLSNIVKTIKNAMANNHKIMVYGDYDADGILATSIVVATFNKIKYPIGYYIPNRYGDGYGLTAEKVKDIIEKGYKLIITVDNGITAHEAIKVAYENNIQVIVTDHHQANGDLPSCEGILHPLYKTNEPQNMCGAAMSLVLSKALLNEYNRYFVTLTAVATIADIMPLISNNRDLVRLGLQYLSEDRYSSILQLNNENIIDEYSIAMSVIPSINAIGRMIEDSRINRLIPYFTKHDEKAQSLLASWIKQTNQIRKKITGDAIINITPLVKENEPIVILTEEKEGMVGLLASRLVNEYEQPTIVLTTDSNDNQYLVGSARTPQGYNLIEAFTNLSKFLVKSGGHANAAGLTIKKSDFNEFKLAVIKFFSENVAISKQKKYLDIAEEEVNIENYNILRSFAPFGHQFSQPLLRIQKIPRQQLTFIKDDKYLSTKLSNGKLFSFNISKDKLPEGLNYDIIGVLKLNRFRNQEEINLFVTSIFPN